MVINLDSYNFIGHIFFAFDKFFSGLFIFDVLLSINPCFISGRLYLAFYNS